MSGTPQCPGPRRSLSRRRRKVGDDEPSRTALSMARASSALVADRARSRMVREADVHLISSIVVVSMRSILRAVCTVQIDRRLRSERGTVKSWEPSGNPSNPWRAAAARPDTTACGPRSSRPALRSCRQVGGAPTTRNT